MAEEPTVFTIESDNREGEAASLLRAWGFSVRTFQSCEAFLESPDSDAPGCIVADGRMSGVDGLSLIKIMTSEGRWKPFIIITDSDDIETAVSAMKNGAVDVVVRPLGAPCLTDKVAAALELDSRHRAHEMLTCGIKARISRLTQRERQVLDLVVAGLSSKMIAQRLGIRHRTVEVHRAHLMEKMRARSSAELIRMAVTAKPSRGAFGTADDRGAQRLALTSAAPGSA